MSKERELLKRVRDALRELKETHYNLYWDIQSMLDQPEQTEQFKPDWVNYRQGVEDAKPKPLSNEWLEDNIGLIHMDVSFTDLVRAVEKAHGIGVDDE